MAMGPNANAVESLDLRTPGAHGGELTMEILILISQLRAKGGEDAVFIGKAAEALAAEFGFPLPA